MNYVFHAQEAIPVADHGGQQYQAWPAPSATEIAPCIVD